jgi:hypothetical protein
MIARERLCAHVDQQPEAIFLASTPLRTSCFSSRTEKAHIKSKNASRNGPVNAGQRLNKNRPSVNISAARKGPSPRSHRGTQKGVAVVTRPFEIRSLIGIGAILEVALKVKLSQVQFAFRLCSAPALAYFA